MKLYYSPGACSLASHILLNEAGAAFQAVRVNLKDKTTESGADFAAINPKGYVPALQLDDGQVLGENTALLGYIAELDPAKGLIPPAGTLGNFRVREWLGYVSSELHKSYSPLFRPNLPEATAQAQRELIAKRLAYVDGQLAGKQYLTGDAFTPADAYLFVVANWSGHVGVDLSPYANLRAFQARVAARPAVHKALVAEGLVKAA